MMTANEIAIKWLDFLGLSEEIKDAAIKIIDDMDIKEIPKFSDYDNESEEFDDKKRYIYFLLFCEELSKRYEEKGIPTQILSESLQDFKDSTISYYEKNNTLGFAKGTTEWLINHFSFNLFRLGRLQFCMYGMYEDVPEKNIKKGDPVIDVHIPRGASLNMESVDDAFQKAKVFFAKYFPDYKFEYYTCFSWMLDDTLKQFLSEESNIMKYKNLYEVVHTREMDSALYFAFSPTTTRENIKDFEPKSSLQRKLKEYTLSGGKFYNSLGIRKA